MTKNLQDNFPMGLIFRTSWRVAPTKKKSLMGIWIFQKRFQKYRISVANWSQNLRFSHFSFGLIFKRITSQIWKFSQNLRLSYFSFGFIFKRICSHIWKFSQNLRFSYCSFGLIFKRIYSQKKASLARTVPKPSRR